MGCLILLAMPVVFAIMVWAYVSIVVAGPLWVSLLFMAMLLLPWLLKDPP
jgi:hypothetical protein